MTVRIGTPRQLKIIGTLNKQTGQVEISRDALRFLDDAYRRLGGQVDAVENAAASSSYGVGNPPTFIWRSDSAGVFPAGDPTADLVMTFYDPDGAAVAVRTLRGTLESSTGNITVTDVSSSGLATSYVLYGDGTDSVRADIMVVLETGKELEASLTWNSLDLSVAGGTPTVISGGSGGGGGGGGAK